jgi:hypothetical protein
VAFQVPRLPVALHASDEALTLTIGTTRLCPPPVQRDARGGLDVGKLCDQLRELAALQADVHAVTLHRESAPGADDVRRMTEACVARASSRSTSASGRPSSRCPSRSTPLLQRQRR